MKENVEEIEKNFKIKLKKKKAQRLRIYIFFTH